MHLGEVVHMVGMGLLVSVLAPALVLATRRRFAWRALSWPAAVALPCFVVLHALLTVEMAFHEPGPPMHLVLDGVLLLGAVVFWLPVLGRLRPLGPAGRVLYLFLAAPALDLAAVVVVAVGDSAGGLSMIVGMLPIGLAAVIVTWQWIRADEAQARQLDLVDDLVEIGGISHADP